MDDLPVLENEVTPKEARKAASKKPLPRQIYHCSRCWSLNRQHLPLGWSTYSWEPTS